MAVIALFLIMCGCTHSNIALVIETLWPVMSTFLTVTWLCISGYWRKNSLYSLRIKACLDQYDTGVKTWPWAARLSKNLALNELGSGISVISPVLALSFIRNIELPLIWKSSLVRLTASLILKDVTIISALTSQIYLYLSSNFLYKPCSSITNLLKKSSSRAMIGGS